MIIFSYLLFLEFLKQVEGFFSQKFWEIRNAPMPFDFFLPLIHFFLELFGNLKGYGSFCLIPFFLVIFKKPGAELSGLLEVDNLGGKMLGT